MSIAIQGGVLYVVATPIGNLGDISQRALAVLDGVDLIAAEDTRHSQRLLQHFNIHTPLLSYHDHNEQQRLARLQTMLDAGQSVALISDAGTPLISDPGFVLVRWLRERGYQIVPIPGASSVLSALMVAGLPTDRFAFEGFLPAREHARRERLLQLKDYPHTLIFFEAPGRLGASLAAMAAVFGDDRPAVVARELTKHYEEIRSGSLGELAEHWTTTLPRGEIVILTQGLTADPDITADTERLLLALLEELPLKRAAAVVAKVTGVAKNRLYQHGLTLQQGN